MLPWIKSLNGPTQYIVLNKKINFVFVTNLIWLEINNKYKYPRPPHLLSARQGGKSKGGGRSLGI